MVAALLIGAIITLGDHPAFLESTAGIRFSPGNGDRGVPAEVRAAAERHFQVRSGVVGGLDFAYGFLEDRFFPTSDHPLEVWLAAPAASRPGFGWHGVIRRFRAAFDGAGRLVVAVACWDARRGSGAFHGTWLAGLRSPILDPGCAAKSCEGDTGTALWEVAKIADRTHSPGLPGSRSRAGLIVCRPRAIECDDDRVWPRISWLIHGVDPESRTAVFGVSDDGRVRPGGGLQLHQGRSHGFPTVPGEGRLDDPSRVDN